MATGSQLEMMGHKLRGAEGEGDTGCEVVTLVAKTAQGQIWTWKEVEGTSRKLVTCWWDGSFTPHKLFRGASAQSKG